MQQGQLEVGIANFRIGLRRALGFSSWLPEGAASAAGKTALILPQKVGAFDRFYGDFRRGWPPIGFPEKPLPSKLYNRQGRTLPIFPSIKYSSFLTHSDEIALISQGD